MISKQTTLHIAGVTAVIGATAFTAQSLTPSASDWTAVDVAKRPVIELIYPQYAQVGGDEIGGGQSGGEDDGGGPVPGNVGPAVEATTGQTTAIVNQLNQIERICEFMGDEYRIACFAQTYRELAKEIPPNGDYEEAREVLLDTARKLDNIVRRNVDRQKPALRARLTTDSGQTVQTPAIRPIRQERVPELNRQAANVVAEAETVLLRTANSDATRAIHYQRIAAAVGSNKVLLRSS